MGTNYYLNIPKCEHCNAPDTKLHIGKAAVGWAFALHIIWERQLYGLSKWLELIDKGGSFITDEYGQLVTKKELVDIITYPTAHDDDIRILQHHEVDGIYCMGNAKTYDLLVGEFT